MPLILSAALASPFAGIPLGMPPDGVPTTVVYAGQKGRLWTRECDGAVRGIEWTVRQGKRVRAQGPRLRDLVQTALEAEGWSCARGPELTLPDGREQRDLCRREGDLQIVVHDELSVRSGHIVTLSTGASRCHPILGDFDEAM